jgi:hypothetical protein
MVIPVSVFATALSDKQSITFSSNQLINDKGLSLISLYRIDEFYFISF